MPNVDLDHPFAHLAGSPVVGRFFHPDGTLAVRIAGGADDDGSGDNDGGDDDSGTDGGDDEGTGTDGEDSEGSGTDDAAAAEAAKWKALSRKHERQSKANAAELDKLRKAGLSDQDKAIEEAREAGRAEAAKASATKLAAAELKAVGVPKDLVEDLDLTKFLDDSGEVDADKVEAHAKRYSAITKQGSGSADGGPRGGDKPTKATSLEGAVAAALNPAK